MDCNCSKPTPIKEDKFECVTSCSNCGGVITIKGKQGDSVKGPTGEAGVKGQRCYRSRWSARYRWRDWYYQ